MRAMRNGALFLSAMVSACSSADDPATSEPATFCEWNFEATVRRGPDMGAAYRGPMYLRATTAGAAEGELLARDAAGAVTEVPVHATYDAANLITLRFTLADGRTLSGTGPMGAPFSTCPRSFTGSANGPAADDTGDWVTSFFGNGSDAGTPTCTTPTVSGATFSNGKVYVNAAGSCIQTGATLRLQIPYSTTTYGPYALQFDDSGTRMVTPQVGATAWPAGQCRVVYVHNPNGSEGVGSGCR